VSTRQYSIPDKLDKQKGIIIETDELIEF